MSAPGRCANADEILAAARFLEGYWRSRNDVSFDPYDSLESTRLPAISSWPRGAQLVLVQFNKRSPLNFRRLEGIAPTRNSYTSAHFAVGLYCDLDNTQYTRPRVGGYRRLDWLCDSRIDGAWGYPFDVQTKTFELPTYHSKYHLHIVQRRGPSGRRKVLGR